MDDWFWFLLKPPTEENKVRTVRRRSGVTTTQIRINTYNQGGVKFAVNRGKQGETTHWPRVLYSKETTMRLEMINNTGNQQTQPGVVNAPGAITLSTIAGVPTLQLPLRRVYV